MQLVECKKRAPRKTKKDHDHTTGLWFVGVLFFLCFVPTVLVFVYNVYKDPATPQLIENLIQIAKEKSFGNLSKTQKKAGKQT